MDARELRIGNFVNYEGYNSVVTGVIDVPLFGRCVIIGDNEPGEKDVYPIPLTEEWLVKLRFETKDNHYFEKEYRANYSIRGFFVNEHLMISLGSALSKPKHVHQLQNLLFALTGEELTINE